jgi:hypothetical protein
MTATSPRHFRDVTALEPSGAGRFTATVDPEWTIGGKPNGGYLLATLGRAARSICEHADILAASAHYLHAPDPGPVVIETELLRAGRSATQVQATMLQDGAACVTALLTVGTLRATDEPYWAGGLPARSPARIEDGVALPGAGRTGFRVAIMDQIELRLEPESAGFTTGAPRGRGELRGWLSLGGGEPFDSTALLFAVDAFPPATFDIEFSGWVPTFELTAYLRARPAPGPVQVLQRAQLIDGQRVDEACFVWDSTGRLVAQATQLAGIRLG